MKIYSLITQRKLSYFFVADPSVAGSQNGYGSQQQMLEEENESLADQLRDKVKALKSVSEVSLSKYIKLLFSRFLFAGMF